MPAKKQSSGNAAFVIIAVCVIIAVTAIALILTGKPSASEGGATVATTPATAHSSSSVPKTSAAHSTTAEARTTKKPNQTTASTASKTESATPRRTSSDKIVGGYVTKYSGDIEVGELILVNAKVKYAFPDGIDRVEMSAASNGCYTVAYSDMWYNRVSMDALNRMTKDFKARYSNDLMIVSGYRSYSSQETIFNRGVANKGLEEALKWYARPGTSEHHTGYAFDFRTDYDGTGNYKWINQNCYKYGFVVRYDPKKSDITGISSEPWHFRYVGIPHAYYMVKNDLCLEEYIDLLRGYSYDKPLVIKPEDGGTYYVYYQKSAGEQTKINVSGYKTVQTSGNNVDGFIVTAEK